MPSVCVVNLAVALVGVPAEARIDAQLAHRADEVPAVAGLLAHRVLAGSIAGLADSFAAPPDSIPGLRILRLPRESSWC